jgi:hypothetical protein
MSAKKGHAMADTPPASGRTPDILKDIGHPRGTLAIVAVFGLLFALAWFLTYFFVFLGRGAPHH